MKTVLTKEEKSAIRRLKNLAKTWPQTLQLFSWSSNLEVIHLPSDNLVIDRIEGIPNDGGAPSSKFDEDGGQHIDYE